MATITTYLGCAWQNLSAGEATGCLLLAGIVALFREIWRNFK